MRTHEYKADCTLHLNGAELPGLAHVIEVEYSPRIRFCNFVMQITLDNLEGGSDAPINDGGLTLPDGRTAAVKVTHFQLAQGYFEVASAGSVPPR